MIRLIPKTQDNLKIFQISLKCNLLHKLDTQKFCTSSFLYQTLHNTTGVNSFDQLTWLISLI